MAQEFLKLLKNSCHVNVGKACTVRCLLIAESLQGTQGGTLQNCCKGRTLISNALAVFTSSNYQEVKGNLYNAMMIKTAVYIKIWKYNNTKPNP